MKSILKIVSLLALFFFSLNFTSTAQTAEVKIKTSLQCDECKERIEKALAFEKGIKSSNVNVETKEVTVVYYDKRTTPEKIREVISNTGYDADDVKANDKAYNKLPKCCKKGGH